MNKQQALKIDFTDLGKVLLKLVENVKKENDEWSLIIYRELGHYILEANNTGFKHRWIIEDDEEDELKSHERLLNEVMDYFVFGGSKHDTERLRIIREKK